MKAIDRTEVGKKHRGMWIAFDNDQVTILAVHKEMKIAWQQAKDKGYDPIMERMPDDPNMVYIPTFFEVQLSDL